MILAIKDIKTSLKKFNPGLIDLRFVSYCIAGYAVFYYPHTMLGGVVMEAPAAIEAFICISFALYACSKISTQETLFTSSPLSRPVAALCILVIITTATAKNVPLALEAIFLFLAYIGCFYIFLDLFNTGKYLLLISWIIVLGAIYLSADGLHNFHLMNQRFDNIWRLRSTFGNSNQMSGFLALTIPFCVGFIFSKKFTPLLYAILFTGLCIMAIAQFFTLARGGWVSTIVATGFVLVFHMAQNKKDIKKILGIGLSALLILSLAFLSSTDLVKRLTTLTQPNPQESIYGRLVVWDGTIDMISAHPLVGVGPGNFRTAFTQFQPPGLTEPYIIALSDYLEFTSETGLLLIPILLWLGFRLFSHGFTKIRRTADPQTRGITLGAMGGIIAILVYSFTDFNLQIPANALLFTVLAALVAAPATDKSGGVRLA